MSIVAVCLNQNHSFDVDSFHNINQVTKLANRISSVKMTPKEVTRAKMIPHTYPNLNMTDLFTGVFLPGIMMIKSPMAFGYFKKLCPHCVFSHRTK